MSVRKITPEMRKEIHAAKYETSPKQKKSPTQYILEQQKMRTKQDLLRLRIAIDSAENVTSYDRELLHNVFREVIKDASLTSNWESRVMKVMQRKFKVVNEAGKENKDLTKVLESQWFRDFVKLAMESHLWGFSLIEFGPLLNGEFLPYKVDKKNRKAVSVLDRDNVKPELGIITRSPGDADGVAFDDKRYADYLMFVGDYQDRGILDKAAKLILFKDNCLGNWSEWAEVFGMDKRIGKTRAEGDDRKNFLKALRDIGSNAYGVFGVDDEVEYLGTQRTDAYKVYLEYCNYVDGQIAKLIFGQDVISNNTGRVVGTVGENVANMYGDSDAAMIEYLVNTKLFPLMENLGFSWQGHKYMWDNTEILGLKDRSEIDYKISQMGKTHSDDYINNTYGVEVEEKEVPTPMAINEKLKAMYNG